MDVSEYEFMRRAFIVGGLITVILPRVGQAVPLKRPSTIGDTFSHPSLVGLTIEFTLGLDPLLAAIIVCVFAELSIEVIKNKLKPYQEASTVIVLTTSTGLVGILPSIVKNTNNVSLYLLGPIVTISDEEFYLVVAVSAFVLISYSLLYKSLYLSISDQRATSILDINIKLINFCVMFLSATAILTPARTIGSLIVSSLLVLLSISAMQYTRTYKSTLIVSIISSVISVYLSLFMSYALNLKPGSVVVLLSVIWLVISLITKRKQE